MINRKHRIIATLVLCAMLLSVVAIPISHSKEKPNWLMRAWIALTAALEILDAIERAIGIITEDLKEMEEAVAEANKELDEVLFPERKKREAEIAKEQEKLDELNAEHEAALQKRRNAKSRIRSLKIEIRQAEADLEMLSPWEYEAREALELHISMLKSSLESAEQDVKDANKIINSNWRALKRAYYESVISRLETLLISHVTGRIGHLEALTDYLRPKIERKQGELETETERRKLQQAEVDKERANYKKKKKEGNPNAQK